MAIKKIDIYLQIYAYTEDYVRALVASPEAEPVFTGEQGAWFGLNTDDGICQYLMNPCLVSEGIKPLTIYDIPASATNDIMSIMSYQNILDYFYPAISGGILLTDSVTYATIEHDGVSFVFPKYSTNPKLLPMRVRFFYRVTYGDDNLVAMFPTQVNGYYETVLNATRNFQFTEDTENARWGSEPEWKVFDKTGVLQLDSDTGISAAISSQYDEFYIAVNVPVLGKLNNTSVNHYNINNFFLDNGSGLVISTTNEYPVNSSLGELMTSEGSFWQWKQSVSGGKGTYDNSEYYLASARFSKTILFKILPHQCIELMTYPILNLTYLDQPAIDTCATGYKATLTINTADLTLSSDGLVSFDDYFNTPLSAMVNISNPSDQLIENITYSLKMKRYAIRTKTTSTGVIDSWGSLEAIADGGIDMGEDCVFSITNSVSAGASVSGTFQINYSEISDFADKCGYTLPAGKSIASGIFIFELEISYGSTTKTTELAFRLGYRHCISMRTENSHGILQDSSNKWSGIKDVDLTITEVSDVTLSKVGSLNSLYTISASLIYVSPVSKTIVNYGVGSFGSSGSIGSYGVMSGTTTKRVILAGADGRAWGSSYYTNLQTGSAYLSILLVDSNGGLSLSVQNVAMTIDIVAPPVFDITTTPDGSEIDDNSEAEFSE
ncbi:MAG: hypothetical protein PHS01_10555 [Dysgonamonadaceae bacterium]|nr:hypothetical protein [Dysgonamonadaceae bacterium]